MKRTISVCIPAYNRANVLPDLLESIATQNYDDYEVLICEDKSPEREQIRAVVEKYSTNYPGHFTLLENEKNLGYDGNMRKLVANAQGDFCLFMGNDDILCPGALKRVDETIKHYKNLGVIVRSYSSFYEKPENVIQVFKYFPEERLFPAGPHSIATLYRRSVVISGMVVNTAAARKLATTQYDGTLLYQVYLVGALLVNMDGVYLPDIIAYYRNGGVPDFGNAEAEKGKFVPANRTPDSSLHFMKGMLTVAAGIEKTFNVPIYDKIVNDLSNYSYPFIAIQSEQPTLVFIKYWWSLARMGFGKHVLFHVYFIALLTIGQRNVDKVIATIKRRLGHTPALGSIFRGKAKS